MESNDKKDNKRNPAEKNSAPAANTYEQVGRFINESNRQKIKIHWLIVVLAVLLTLLTGFINEVSLFENLNRCFYAGSIFWIVAEIIDYIIKN